MRGCIYTIAHPVTGVIVYVGRTTRDFEQRMYEHYRKSSNLRLRNFMDDLKGKSLLPKCVKIDSTDCVMDENNLINKLIGEGVDLFNESCGVKPSKSKELFFKSISN